MKRAVLIPTLLALFGLSAAAQVNEAKLSRLVRESLTNGPEILKSGIVGSYPRHTEEFIWNNAWLPYQTIETSYTSFGKPEVIEYNQNGVRTRTIYSYNDQHLETEAVGQNFGGINWTNRERIVAQYNAKGLETEYRHEEWINSAWVVESGSQSEYEFDGDRITVITSKQWNKSTTQWVNYMRETYTYPPTGNHYTSAMLENWDNAWIKSSKSTYTWEGDYVKESMDYEYKNNQWSLFGKTEFEFSANSSIRMTSYMYIAENTWSPMTRITLNYDSHGNATLNQLEMYMGAWTLYQGQRYELTYAGNNLTQRITQEYSMGQPVTQGTTTFSWKNLKKEVFSNFASMGTDPTRLEQAGLSLFPNPASRQVMVRISPQQPGMITVTLFTLTGQTVLSTSLASTGSDMNFPVNLQGIRPGTYLVVATDKQGNEIGKTRLIKE